MHRWILVLAISLACFAVTSAEAAEKVKTSQPGVMLAVEKKSRPRTQYYIVNTPVDTEEPYYEAEIDSGGYVYTVEYELKNAKEVLPDGCLAGQAVKVRIDHRHLFVQCLDTPTEMRWDIQKRKPSAPDSEAPKKP
jgi:hypothetical protein